MTTTGELLLRGRCCRDWPLTPGGSIGPCGLCGERPEVVGRWEDPDEPGKCTSRFHFIRLTDDSSDRTVETLRCERDTHDLGRHRKRIFGGTVLWTPAQEAFKPWPRQAQPA